MDFTEKMEKKLDAIAKEILGYSYDDIESDWNAYTDWWDYTYLPDPTKDASEMYSKLEDLFYAMEGIIGATNDKNWKEDVSTRAEKPESPCYSEAYMELADAVDKLKNSMESHIYIPSDFKGESSISAILYLSKDARLTEETEELEKQYQKYVAKAQEINKYIDEKNNSIKERIKDLEKQQDALHLKDSVKEYLFAPYNLPYSTLNKICDVIYLDEIEFRDCLGAKTEAFDEYANIAMDLLKEEGYFN